MHLVVGHTGAGKSGVAQEIAAEHNAPVVVAARIQCYIDLPVTSARLDGDRHHLTERTVPDGDYPTHAARDPLVAQLLPRRRRLAACAPDRVSPSPSPTHCDLCLVRHTERSVKQSMRIGKNIHGAVTTGLNVI
ncbi:isopentenyl transferase family protein [Lentzea nigeriaca]|uniref:isopentenyl transferase family protein n=1 Tax=Lentzea nigeriaca TaxID=1128665 RepID=UPI00195DB8EA|nr:isopentenyl transferase family protein [Lentzea nigeriaca]MBM7856983.1 hypothetical protein [Lentzea nigeriaca]